MILGVHAFSCPVLQPDGRVAGALTVLGLRGSLDDSATGATAQAIHKAARSFGQRLTEFPPLMGRANLRA